MKSITWTVARGAARRVVGYNDPPPPPSPQNNEELEKAKFEADAARAEAEKIRKQLEEVKRAVPSDEQRARWAELEAAAEKAEQERAMKAGEFEKLKQQLTERYEREIEGHKQATKNALDRAEALEREVEEEMIAREFEAATTLFGPTGKTVWFPQFAMAYLRRYVEIEKSEAGGRTVRRVVVKDDRGTKIVDKNGSPMPFVKAMEELIASHPMRDAILRGSGKVGAGNSGGGHGTSGDIDVSRLKQSDFNDPKVRDAVRNRFAASGGLQVGPGFDKLRQNRNK